MGPCTFAEQPKEAFEQPEGAFAQPISELPEGAFAQLPEQSVAQLFCGTVARLAATSTRTIENLHESSPHQARAAHSWNGA